MITLDLVRLLSLTYYIIRMRIADLQKFLYILFIALFLGITTFYGVDMMQAYREYKVFQGYEEKSQLEFSQCQEKLESQESYVKGFLNDSDFFE